MTPAAPAWPALPASPPAAAGARRKPGGRCERELRQAAETEKTAAGQHGRLITPL